MRPLALIAFTLLSFLSAVTRQAGADTVFHYTSESGDYIGKGQERTITPAGGYTFQVNGSSSGSVGFYITSSTSSSYESYSLSFAAPTGSTLSVGNYPGATRAAFHAPAEPGLEFSANSSGSNMLTGQFQILEISFSASGSLATFAANFVQHSEGAAPASYGQIRYNSSIPYASPSGVGQLAANNYSVFETAGLLTVSATRRDGSTGPLSVNYSTADGTDLAGRDYTATAGTLSWATGDSANKAFTVPVLNSGNPSQGNGTFFVNLSGAGTGAQTQAVVTVVNDNSAVTFVHFISDAGDYIGQGEERTFSIADDYVITASRNSGGVSFSWDNSQYVDFSVSEYWSANFAAASGTIFGVGDFENAMRYPFQTGTSPGLDISGDGRGSNTLTGNFQVLEAQFDNNGTVLKFAANFEQHSEGGSPALRGQVRYNSTVPVPVVASVVQFSSSAYSVAENAGSKTITVNRTSGSLGAVSVLYATADGTAVAGTNYTPVSGTLTWASGDTTAKTFVVPVIDDGVYSSNLSVNLTLTGSAVGTLSQSSLILTNQDPAKPGVVQFSGPTFQTTDTSRTATITVTRTGGSSGSLSVKYATANGTATAGTDYNNAAGTLSWADGDAATKSFTVTLLDPVTTQASQTVLLNLTGTGLGSVTKATLVITNSNFPPVGTVALSAANFTANEADGTATITVNRTGGSFTALTVNYATQDGTALAGQDYVATNGTLDWVSGDSSPKLFTVPIIDAQIGGGGLRTLKIVLTGANLGAVTQSTLTIADNDGPLLPVVTATTTTPTIQENGGVPGVFTLSRTGDLTLPLTVTYKVGGTAVAARDYLPLKGMKTIKAGKSSVNVKVTPIDIGATGGGKLTVKLTVEPQTDVYNAGGDGKAKVKIIQND